MPILLLIALKWLFIFTPFISCRFESNRKLYIFIPMVLSKIGYLLYVSFIEAMAPSLSKAKDCNYCEIDNIQNIILSSITPLTNHIHRIFPCHLNLIASNRDIQPEAIQPWHTFCSDIKPPWGNKPELFQELASIPNLWKSLGNTCRFSWHLILFFDIKTTVFQHARRDVWTGLFLFTVVCSSHVR